MIVGENYGLRSGTNIKPYHCAFIFNAGGMGDFVNYSAATLWLAENVPWFTADIYVPRYLVPLFKDIHECREDFKVIASENFGSHYKQGTPMVGPDIVVRGQNVSPQFLTVIHAHPFDVGFAYYVGETPPPEGAALPILDYPKTLELEKYVVFTAGNIHRARMTTGKHLNPVIEHCVARGLTPVFLGKTDRLGAEARAIIKSEETPMTMFPEDVRYDLGLDLREKTTVKEAAAIMQHAVCTVGLDTGLLHLAALMKDSKIVFGYNITTVAHRKPRRNHGKVVDVFLTEKDLICIGCQSKSHKVHYHKFSECLYRDNLCIDLLFSEQRFERAIDELVL